MAAKIKDFGEKIGGARKDLWIKGGLTKEYLDDMNEYEKRKMVNRDNVWPLINAKKLVESGIPAFVVYWQRYMRKFSSSQPKMYLENLNKECESYVEIVSSYKNEIMSVKTENDIQKFYEKLGEYMNEWKPYVSVYNAYYTKRMLRSIKYKCEAINFPYNTSKRKKVERKKTFIPPQLEHIEREGENYRSGININADIWQRTFNFRGVEFGNWMSQKDRQVSMNYCYDAWKDLAVILDIEDKDISFNGKLALGFGSRGCSRALAHYEPMREVINLTKMRGAGCTAHEWAHALDDMLAKHYGIKSELASEDIKNSLLPKSFVTLINAMKYDTDGNKTNFYKGSTIFGRQYSKDSHGYWNSNAEMFARAFACYVKDTYGKKSDYLFAHADTYVFEYDDQMASAIPQGEEREILDELFDCLIFDLKKIGILHQREHKCKKIIITKNELANYDSITNQGLDGQMSWVV